MQIGVIPQISDLPVLLSQTRVDLETFAELLEIICESLLLDDIRNVPKDTTHQFLVSEMFFLTIVSTLARLLRFLNVFKV